MAINFKGKTALITGASSGLGTEFARQLAEHGSNLVLVARRRDRLETIASELRDKYGVNISFIDQDLSTRTSGDELLNKLENQGMNIDILVNNAGFATNASVVNENRAIVANEIQLNVGTLVELTVGLTPTMKKRDFGVVINVASTAAFQPVTNMAVYGATKAFVLSFTQALYGELNSKNIKILAICPGATMSEFWEVSGMGHRSTKGFETPETVVKNALNEILKKNNNPHVVSGTQNRILASSVKFLPIKSVIKMTGKMFQPAARS